jgi:hypothetical protein
MNRLLLSTVILAAACGASGTTPDSDGGGGNPAVDLAGTTALVDLAGVDLVGADLSAGGAYPAAPYGNKVGDVIPLLVWEGYANDTADAISTTKPFGAYSMDDLRRLGRPYLMVHVSEFS